MIVVDVNLLLYAYNVDVPQHERARRWFESVLAAAERVALPYSVIHAFIRLSTSRIMPSPLSATHASAAVEEWLMNPVVHVIEPGPRYWPLFRELVVRGELGGNIINDAHIAALAMEHGGTVYSADRDFRRFTGLRVINPLAS